MRRRILYVHPSVNKPCGPDISLFELVRRLDRSRFEPFLMVPRESELVRKFEPFVSGVFVIPEARLAPPPSRPRELIGYLWSGVSGCPRLRRFLKRHRIQMVHINIETAQAVGWAARSLGLPTIVHMRGLTPLKTAGLARLVTVSMRAAGGHFVAVSDAVADAYAGAGLPGERIHTISNGIDTGRFTPEGDAAREGVPEGQPAAGPWIGAVSSADPRKGWAYLVMACALLRSRHPGLRCLLVGDRGSGSPLFWKRWTYLETLDALVDSLGLGETVRFTGPVPDTAPYYRAFDLLAQPSVTDAGPRAVLEAMACGKPVVATRVGGNASYVEDGESGLLVDCDDPSALARGIDRVLSDDTLRAKMGSQARERALRLYSIDRHVEKVSRLYDQLLAEGT